MLSSVYLSIQLVPFSLIANYLQQSCVKLLPSPGVSVASHVVKAAPILVHLSEHEVSLPRRGKQPGHHHTD